MSGRASKEYHRSLLDGKIYVGRREHPVAVIKRREIPDYMTEEFFDYLDAWSYYHAGMGLPLGGGWGEYPEHFISVIRAFEFEMRSVKSGATSTRA